MTINTIGQEAAWQISDAAIRVDGQDRPAADVVDEERHRVQVIVQLGVVIQTSVPLQLHRLPEQCLQPSWGEHHRGRQVCYKHKRGTQSLGSAMELTFVLSDPKMFGHRWSALNKSLEQVTKYTYQDSRFWQYKQFLHLQLSFLLPCTSHSHKHTQTELVWKDQGNFIFLFSITKQNVLCVCLKGGQSHM